ncbi:hypothetical protein BDW75DRAFT_200258 [Aspergillus navahoensis]
MKEEDLKRGFTDTFRGEEDIDDPIFCLQLVLFIKLSAIERRVFAISFANCGLVRTRYRLANRHIHWQKRRLQLSTNLGRLWCSSP